MNMESLSKLAQFDWTNVDVNYSEKVILL